jgi:hypothetical protein
MIGCIYTDQWSAYLPDTQNDQGYTLTAAINKK